MNEDQRPLVFVVCYYNRKDKHTYISNVFEIEQEAKDKVKELNKFYGWNCADYRPTILIKEKIEK